MMNKINFWKKKDEPDFRNVESFDDASSAVPVKVSYFEGDAQSTTSVPVSTVGIHRTRNVEVPMDTPMDTTMDSTEPVTMDDELGGEKDEPARLDRKKVMIILFVLFTLGVGLLVGGIELRSARTRENVVAAVQQPIYDDDWTPDTATTPTPERTRRPTRGPTTAPEEGNSPTGVPTKTAPEEGDSPTDVPTKAPISDAGSGSNPTMLPSAGGGVEDSWMQLLSPVTGSETFQQDSPQRTALEWLMNEDAAKLDPTTTNRTRQLLTTERYIAAVFYFATGGAEWAQQLNFLSGDSICSWNDEGPNGITCNNRRVTNLFIADNNLKGTIPSEINGLRQLQSLDLFYNHLTGPIPYVGNLTSLTHIDADGNQLTGNVPASLFNLPLMEEILLLNNPGLTGSIPSLTADAPKLQRLSFYNCNITGSLPGSLGKATNLTDLQFYQNSLTGSIPSSVTTLPKLKLLSLRRNKLTGTLPAFAGQSSLTEISLGENNLSGPLPSSLGSLLSLTTLYLQENQFTGIVPTEMRSLPVIKEVWFYGNKIGGPLPGFSENPGTLQQLYLNDNQFNATLGPMLRNAPASIKFLQLGGNPSVRGNITSDISRFSSMVLFNVSYTSVTGTVPPELSTISLSVLALQSTSMTGDFSSVLCPNNQLLGSLASVSVDCGGASPSVSCSCCTECAGA